MTQLDNLTPHPAALYETHIRNIIPYYDCLHAEAINLIKATKIKPRFWLDTGCGTGSFVNKALEFFNDTIFILTDPSPAMLDLAKQKLAGRERVRFLDPVATQSISVELKADVITAIQAHHYLGSEMRRNATQVCFDLLTEDGIYLTFENSRPFSDQGIAIGLENWSNFQQAAGRDHETVRNHLQRFDSEYFPITVEAHLKLLRECGFRTVELLWFSYLQVGFYGIK